MESDDDESMLAAVLEQVILGVRRGRYRTLADPCTPECKSAASGTAFSEMHLSCTTFGHSIVAWSGEAQRLHGCCALRSVAASTLSAGGDAATRAVVFNKGGGEG